LFIYSVSIKIIKFHCVQGLFRRIVTLLQRVIDCRGVTEGTTTYVDTQEAIQTARTGLHAGAVYTRRSRSVRGRGASST